MIPSTRFVKCLAPYIHYFLGWFRLTHQLLFYLGRL